MKNALVTTTINTPVNLEAYASDIAVYGPADTSIIVAGDMKSPHAEILVLKDKIQKKYKVDFIYLMPEEQAVLFEAYSKWLPWNCIQRRNVALLYAYKNGAEIIATIDDDNFWEGNGYFKGHGDLGIESNFPAFETENGWFNVCGRLYAKGDHFYHRGYSTAARSNRSSRPAIGYHASGKVVVNAGLWLGDPDVDAVTRLAISPNVIEMKNEEGFSGNIVLAHGTKSPFNSQNTALHRDVIPAYCMLPHTGRYDDIIPSYFVKRIADHLGDYIRFGSPVVRQIRNNHDLWRDLEEERVGMQLTDQIVDWLYEIELTKGTYKECIVELIDAFSVKAKTLKPYKLEHEVFLHNIAAGYREWLKHV